MRFSHAFCKNSTYECYTGTQCPFDSHMAQMFGCHLNSSLHRFMCKSVHERNFEYTVHGYTFTHCFLLFCASLYCNWSFFIPHFSGICNQTFRWWCV